MGSCMAHMSQRVSNLLQFHQAGAHHLCEGDGCTPLCVGAQALLEKGGCSERGKKCSSSNVVGTNGIREGKNAVIRHCFLPCTMVCREPPTGPPPPPIRKRLRQVKFQHGKYGVDVNK